MPLLRRDVRAGTEAVRIKGRLHFKAGQLRQSCPERQRLEHALHRHVGGREEV